MEAPAWKVRVCCRAYRSLLAASYDAMLAPVERHLGRFRRELLQPLQGDVLELGPGTGANLPYFGSEVRWRGLEPCDAMRSRLERRLSREGRPGSVMAGSAEAIPLDRQSMDAVVATLVLCSVADPARALSEAARVLRPGGRFVFLEHVAAPEGTWCRRWQGLLAPAWALFADGCHLARSSAASVATEFGPTACERFWLPWHAAPLFLRYWCAGSAALRQA